MLYTVSNNSISVTCTLYCWTLNFPATKWSITHRWMCNLYILRQQHPMWLTALRNCSLHGNFTRRRCFVLCLSWGVGLSAQHNKSKRLLMLSSLSVFVTRHFSFSPFNNGDRNFVNLNNDLFVPMGSKNTQMTKKKKHSTNATPYSWKYPYHVREYTCRTQQLLIYFNRLCWQTAAKNLPLELVL